MRPVAAHKEQSQLVGEFLRECAVLMLVLYPLEAYLQNKFDWWGFIFIASLSLVLLWRGIILEGDDEL
jgi:hypothetical protein